MPVGMRCMTCSGSMRGSWGLVGRVRVLLVAVALVRVLLLALALVLELARSRPLHGGVFSTTTCTMPTARR